MHVHTVSKYLNLPQIPTRAELVIYTHVVLYFSRYSCAYTYTYPSRYIMLPNYQSPIPINPICIPFQFFWRGGLL